ncbi:hypothetical protein GCM10010275_43500 [Streptomyces litmocidini]|nr:hypothetical protein GCM10010275_43500 [Streptomyces litmocidini]
MLQRHGGAHAALAPAVNGESFAPAPAGLRRGGRLVMVALPADGVVQAPVFSTVLGGASINGSIVGTRQDPAGVFRLHAAGRTRVIDETRPLSSVDDCIDEALHGRVKARIVFAV